MTTMTIMIKIITAIPPKYLYMVGNDIVFGLEMRKPNHREVK